MCCNMKRAELVPCCSLKGDSEPPCSAWTSSYLSENVQSNLDIVQVDFTNLSFSKYGRQHELYTTLRLPCWKGAHCRSLRRAAPAARNVGQLSGLPLRCYLGSAVCYFTGRCNSAQHWCHWCHPCLDCGCGPDSPIGRMGQRGKPVCHQDLPSWRKREQVPRAQKTLPVASSKNTAKSSGTGNAPRFRTAAPDSWHPATPPDRPKPNVCACKWTEVLEGSTNPWRRCETCDNSVLWLTRFTWKHVSPPAEKVEPSLRRAVLALLEKM